METADEQPLTPQEEAEFDRLDEALTPAHYAELEEQLFLYARVTGWTGDPFQQPARVVLNLARRVLFPRPAEVRSTNGD